MTESDPKPRVLIPPGRETPIRPPRDVIWRMSGAAVGVAWAVEAVPGVASLQPAVEAALAETAAGLAALVDASDPRGEIARFNAAPPGMWELSPPLFALLNAALDLSDETMGGWDPTPGALTALWRDAAPPSDEVIEAALKVSGWQAFRMNRPAKAALQPGGLRLDLMPLFEGLLADRLSERLSADGLNHHLVVAGRCARGAGVRPDLKPWALALPEQPPFPPAICALHDLAVSRRGRDEGVLDPIGGRPVANGVVSATVLDGSAARAHAFAMGLRVMGPYEGRNYAGSAGLAALIVEETPRGLVEHVTPAWRAMAEEGA